MAIFLSGNYTYNPPYAPCASRDMKTTQEMSLINYARNLNGSKTVDMIVTDVNIYNDKTIKLTFADNSSTVVTCEEGDTFSLTEGITLALLKHAFGAHANKTIKSAVKLWNKKQKAIVQAEEDKKNKQVQQAITKGKSMQKAAKRAEQAKAKAAAEKELAIQIQTEAIMRAQDKLRAEGWTPPLANWTGK